MEEPHPEVMLLRRFLLVILSMEAYIRLRDADLALRAALFAIDAPSYFIDTAIGALRHVQSFQCCTFVPPSTPQARSTQSFFIGSDHDQTEFSDLPES